MAKKMKTKKAAAKRFSLTATGKVKYHKAGLRHILTKKSRSLKRQKRGAAIVNPRDMDNVMKCLPYNY